jgi:predicted RNase H-like HicB family nuclease
MRQYTAVIEYDSETNLYIGSIPSIPGAQSQGETLDELQENLKEVLILCLEEMAAAGEPIQEDDVVGIQKIVVNF